MGEVRATFRCERKKAFASSLNIGRYGSTDAVGWPCGWPDRRFRLHHWWLSKFTTLGHPNGNAVANQDEHAGRDGLTGADCIA